MKSKATGWDSISTVFSSITLFDNNNNDDDGNNNNNNNNNNSNFWILENLGLMQVSENIVDQKRHISGRYFSFSPLLFTVCMIPLRQILRKLK